MPFPGGLWWLLCCRQGFTLLRRDYCEASKGVTSEEVEESFELRRQGDEVMNLTQPSRASSLTEETYSLITENCGRMQHEPDAIVKGWLQREVRGGIKKPWLRPRKYWFVLTEDSLDYYSGCEVTAQRLGSLVLTSLCSVLWPDKQTYKETGYWAVTVFGRKHCYRLYTEHLNEAVHWVCALQKVIISKAPLQTPTQLLMHDIEENHNNPEILDQIYRNNPILRYTAGPIYAPLLPFPYGGQGYAGLRDEAVKLFHSLQQLEELRDPILLMQGVLQTCHDLPALVDEIFCQLVKQTTEPPIPGAPTDLRYWQLLVCMSYTFIPSVPILCYLHLHLQRMEKLFPRSAVTHYGHLITQALHKSKGRECVLSLDEIATLIGSQEIPHSTHCPGTTTCYVAITSNVTAQKVSRLFNWWNGPRVDSMFRILIGEKTKTKQPPKVQSLSGCSNRYGIRLAYLRDCLSPITATNPIRFFRRGVILVPSVTNAIWQDPGREASYTLVADCVV
uniref:Pleckstrin homology, MyTH4 and FERM domain containing H3 n=1 Tax=Naja naja TaxID=35670 RepID=A0A8C7DW75_NAJNA